MLACPTDRIFWQKPRPVASRQRSGSGLEPQVFLQFRHQLWNNLFDERLMLPLWNTSAQTVLQLAESFVVHDILILSHFSTPILMLHVVMRTRISMVCFALDDLKIRSVPERVWNGGQHTVIADSADRYWQFS